MSWPHDPDSDQGSEGRRKYGVAILAKKIDDDEFPLTATEYVDAYGDHPVRLDHNRIVSVADIFEYVDQEEFEDFPAFHTAVGEALRREGYRERAPTPDQ